MIRLVIVGAGLMGSLYARTAQSRIGRGLVELAGIVDKDIDKARRIGDELSVPAYGSIGEIGEQGSIDAAYIALPDHLHVEPFLEAARAGWWILVEKPLATNLGDARRMIDAAERHEIGAAVNFSNRLNPVFLRAYERIANGEIGEVVSINTRLNNSISVPRDMLSWASHSSPAWFLMSHCLDLAAWMSGQRAIRAVGQSGGSAVNAIGVDSTDFVHAMVRYDQGASAFFEAAWCLPDTSPSLADLKFQIIGDQGVIRIDTESQMVAEVNRERGLELVPTQNWVIDSLVNLVERIEADPTDRTGLELGFANTATVVAIERSATGGLLQPEIIESTIQEAE